MEAFIYPRCITVKALCSFVFRRGVFLVMSAVRWNILLLPKGELFFVQVQDVSHYLAELVDTLYTDKWFHPEYQEGVLVSIA